MTSRVTRRYVETGDGQLHLTEVGSGRPVVLMHWTPLSAAQFEWELPKVAALGYRAIGVDCMGFGRSERRPNDEPWAVERHAKAVGAALKAVGAQGALVSGGHFSTPVAVEVGLDESVEVAAVSIDGGGLMPPEAITAVLARARRLPGPGLHEDGSHRSFLFDQAVNTYEIFAPGWKLTPKTLPMVYRFIEAYLSTGMPKDMGSTVPYDIAAKLGQLTLPLLVLTSETEPLKPSFEPLRAAARPGHDAHIFPGDHPLHDPDRAGEYAQTLHEFLKRRGLS
jgi:pimeloyl-ACP methyl ester carboxylesterase